MDEKLYRVLFVCTHNRCRSILAEAITNDVASDVFEVRSAGSKPAGVVYQGTLDFLDSQSISTKGLRSESWDVYETFSPDVVITVCDSAAAETCPVWMSDKSPIRIHWGLPDPSKLPPNEQLTTFVQVAEEILRRVKHVKRGLRADIDAKDLQTLFESACPV